MDAANQDTEEGDTGGCGDWRWTGDGRRICFREDNADIILPKNVHTATNKVCAFSFHRFVYICVHERIIFTGTDGNQCSVE